MKVTGFTIIKNAVVLDFPIKEAILSILPVCDDFVVAVGDCDDGTRELIAAIAPDKIRIIDTVWNKDLKSGGQVLADETNKAFQAIESDSDWCFYIQGDEVLHEQYLDAVYKGMEQWKDDKRIDGLLFKYLHFYGSYDYVGISSKWYRNEIRIVRNNKSIYSYRDAQGFRKGKDEKLKVKELDAYMYHYGWVRAPETQRTKSFYASSFWGGENFDEEKFIKEHNKPFDYSEIDALAEFDGTHPAVMLERIERMNWKFDYDLTYNNLKMKDKAKNLLEKWTGKRFFDYKNYISVR
jgi:hypothetical protein